jgi:hypothetical protein
MMQANNGFRASARRKLVARHMVHFVPKNVVLVHIAYACEKAERHTNNKKPPAH